MADERSVYHSSTAREKLDAAIAEKPQPEEQMETAPGKQMDSESQEPRQRIVFDVSAEKHAHPKNDATLYIPGPREREHGEFVPYFCGKPLTQPRRATSRSRPRIHREPGWYAHLASQFRATC